MRELMHRILPKWLLYRFSLFRVVLLAMCCAFIGPVVAQDAERPEVTELTFGVLNSQGATRTLEAWLPTVDLLNDAAAAQELPYTFRLEPHTDTTLLDDLGRGKVDVFLADPAAFVTAEVEVHARSILSVAHLWNGAAYDETGALVFTRADSPINGFPEMVGRKVMGVSPKELTGWKLALQEARKYRLDEESFAADLLFSGGNQREVVYAVQNGLVDVGVIRAGVLEKLAEEGVLSLAEFKPVTPINYPGYPFWSSTPLYPDWVLGAMPDVPESALGLMIDTLLNIKAESPEAVASGGVVWQAPKNYLPVHDLLISLRARPYENYYREAALRIYRAYQWPVRALGAGILLSIVFLIVAVRRNARITEAHKNILKSETRSKHFYRNAIEDHTVFCMLTKDGTISHVNKHFVSALDRSRSSLINQSISEILNGRTRDLLHTQIMQAMGVGATWQGALNLKKSDGKAAWVQCTFIPVTGASNTLSEIAIVASDVTQTRAGVSEAEFNNTLELMQDQVVVLRPGSLELLYVNAAAQERLISDRMGGKWKGKKADKFIREEDLEALKLRCDALEAGPQRRVTWEVEAKNDVTYEISLEYVQPDQDEPRLIAIYRDVSERKVIEKAKNEFIATVSHELRTPLTSMKGALGLALSGAVGEMPDKMNGMINMAANSCDRLVVLINDILDLEKIEAGKMDYNMQVFDLDRMLTEALEGNAFYGDKFGVSFRRLEEDLDGPVLTYGDAARLRQVMDNLMSNAAKFSESDEEIHVTLNRIAGRWRISIRDFGAGIPEAAQPTIFEKFTQADSSDTRSKGGTGLGLSIVKLIVEQHQGRIAFVSKEGTGTEFFVDLPTVSNDEMVVIPRAAPNIETPSTFSDDVAAGLAAVPDHLANTVVERLAERSRRNGLNVEYEVGRVSTKALAEGKSEEGMPLAANWFSFQDRKFLAQLMNDNLMSDRDFCLIEVQHSRDKANSGVDRSMALTEILQDWLVECEDYMPAGQGADLLAVAEQGPLKNWIEGRNLSVAAPTPKLGEHLKSASTDLIAQYGMAKEVATVALYPMNEGKLPQDWPMILIVSRTAGIQSGQGVVSKFSSGGGGRGRRRA